MAKESAQPKFSDQIREAIDSSGMSRYRICKETGIDPPTLSRFMSGKRGLTMQKLDTLAAFLDLRIVSSKRVKPTKKTTKRKRT